MTLVGMFSSGRFNCNVACDGGQRSFIHFLRRGSYRRSLILLRGHPQSVEQIA
jgi:hypothetical protein